jgi:hypothetical protein
MNDAFALADSSLALSMGRGGYPMNSPTKERELKWRVAPSVRLSFDRDGCVLLDTKKGVFYGANMLGSKIWELIRESPDDVAVENLLNRLPADIEVSSREQLARDVEEYLLTLAAQGLLVQSRVA